MASVAARVRCNRGDSQMLPISIAASPGAISQNDAHPSALPLDAGMTAKKGCSSRPLISEICPAMSSLVGNGPYFRYAHDTSAAWPASHRSSTCRVESGSSVTALPTWRSNPATAGMLRERSGQGKRWSCRPIGRAGWSHQHAFGRLWDAAFWLADRQLERPTVGVSGRRAILRSESAVLQTPERDIQNGLFPTVSLHVAPAQRKVMNARHRAHLSRSPASPALPE
jgi:hypothetical protein